MAESTSSGRGEIIAKNPSVCGFKYKIVSKLTLSGRESDDKKIWAKILISKTRFDAWPVFASDFSVVVKSEIVFFDFSLRTRSYRSVTVITFPSAKG